jgi:hypothetical protein
MLSISVRITSNKQYNSGSLFILDIDRAPWGCGASEPVLVYLVSTWLTYAQVSGPPGGRSGMTGLGLVMMCAIRATPSYHGVRMAKSISSREYTVTSITK